MELADCRVSFLKQNGAKHCRGLATGSVISVEEILSLGKFSFAHITDEEWAGMELGSKSPSGSTLFPYPSPLDHPCWGVVSVRGQFFMIAFIIQMVCIDTRQVTKFISSLIVPSYCGDY